MSAWVLQYGGGCGVEGGTDWGGMNVLREEGVSLARRSIPLFTCVKTDQLVRANQLLDLLGFFPLYFKLHYGQKTTYNATLESEITKALACCRKGSMRSFHSGLWVCLLSQ